MALEIVMHPPFAIDVHTLEDGSRLIRIQDPRTGATLAFSLDEQSAKTLANGLQGGVQIASGAQLQLAKR